MPSQLTTVYFLTIRLFPYYPKVVYETGNKDIIGSVEKKYTQLKVNDKRNSFGVRRFLKDLLGNSKENQYVSQTVEESLQVI